MSADSINDNTPKYMNISKPQGTDSNQVCVLIGHSIEAITSAVVLASLGQRIHLYADMDLLTQQIQQYGFEHHLQALWQMYEQQQVITSKALPDSADTLIKCYESASHDEVDNQSTVAFYWLFLDSIKLVWTEDSWIIAFNQSHQQALPVVMSGIEQLGHVADLAQQLQRAWVYYLPFVFLQDGDAYSSMLNPSLWLLGEKTANSSQHLEVLKPLMQHARAAHHADIATIEFARSSIMAMLATRVSFMNEMSRLADSQQVDIKQVSRIMGLDERVGSSYLQAGWGFGGNTLPTELSKLQQSSQTHSLNMPLLQSVMHINEDQKELIFRKFWQYFDGFIDNKTVMVWGGSYKAGSGRTAGSAIHPLLALLWSYNIRTIVYSDKAKAELAVLYQQQPLLELTDTPYEQLREAQAIFIVSWSPRDQLDIGKINQQAMPVFDAQNALTRSQINSLVGDYMGIGRTK
ncbi:MULTISPECIES: UDP-glucose/GDP-mannose dehydrogenase family protein [unclassified Psychrobacter]|uniref:UDP-glucose/GDP-mannose dehydrogenase family protein n=1 Tax=unclassified Psychrobacter TaxID=196806 RepID=UPI0025B5328E|nr:MULTISPECIES: UDP-glucose/GDP-mannose dehydrogenase family protein [unclassified Psychrobacter]MDN3452555.1 UDP-glucose/GDP-mannose dehydrogenase family protein [Psychrobacter sp. APC 3350]MDN3501660.1 UDP-glucose/GDP-mannose dehydrogenase family protein [Psychrobacter sp. 5A.1]